MLPTIHALPILNVLLSALNHANVSSVEVKVRKFQVLSLNIYIYI